MSSQFMKDRTAETEQLLRARVKQMHAQLPPNQQKVFRLMYDRHGKFENPVDALTDAQLDWALLLIENGLKAYKAALSKEAGR